MDSLAYVADAEAFADYIFGLIPEHPEIMDMLEPHELRGIKGFRWPQGLSLFQTTFALSAAQMRYLFDVKQKQ